MKTETITKISTPLEDDIFILDKEQSRELQNQELQSQKMQNKVELQNQSQDQRAKKPETKGTRDRSPVS